MPHGPLAYWIWMNKLIKLIKLTMFKSGNKGDIFGAQLTGLRYGNLNYTNMCSSNYAADWSEILHIYSDAHEIEVCKVLKCDSWK